MRYKHSDIPASAQPGQFQGSVYDARLMRVPSNHNSGFAPVPEPTITAGVTTMTAAVLELLGRK